MSPKQCCSEPRRRQAGLSIVEMMVGMVIGLMEDIKETPRLILRGAVTGLLVSFAFYSADGFGDAVSFLAGIVYGIIIELAARKR